MSRFWRDVFFGLLAIFLLSHRARRGGFEVSPFWYHCLLLGLLW